MANAANLVNFGSGGLNVGDWTYSAYPLTAPAYLPLNNDEASYLTSSYPTLGAIYAPTTVAYSASSKNVLPIRNPNGTNRYWNALFGNKNYIFWSGNGNLLVSSDLTTWVSRSIPGSTVGVKAYATLIDTYSPSAAISWAAMCYGNGKIVAVRSATAAGAFTQGTSAMSNDGGITWIFGGLPQVVISGGTGITTWTGLVYADGTFTAYGYTPASGGATFYGNVAQSSDGVNWILKTPPGVWGPSGNASSFIIYGNGTYAYFLSSTPTVNYSNDNFVSTIASTLTALWPNSGAYGNGVFVVVGTDNTGAATNVCYSSPTGATWTSRTLPSTQTWTSVTFANGYFVAVGTTGAASTAIATSPDGITWTSQVVPSSNVRGTVAGGMGKFFYQNDYSASAQTITQINLSTSATTFTLPMISTPPFGTIPYMKAT